MEKIDTLKEYETFERCFREGSMTAYKAIVQMIEHRVQRARGESGKGDK